MTVVDKKRDPTTGKWLYKLRDNNDNRIFAEGDEERQWIRESDLRLAN